MRRPSASAIRNSLEKHLDVESVDYPDIKDFQIRRDGSVWIVQTTYDETAPLFSNISLVVSFDKTVRDPSNAVRASAMRRGRLALALGAGEAGLRSRAMRGCSAPRSRIAASSAPNNERLEFLGDAVLNLLIAEHLYGAFPNASEGDLSRLRSRLVSGESLARSPPNSASARRCSSGSGELKTGGFRRKSILADALEALCGAHVPRWRAWQPRARQCVSKLFGARIAALPAPATLKDAKTRLQEHLQAQGLALPAYVVERVEGEPHAHTFWVRCEHAALARTRAGAAAPRAAAPSRRPPSACSSELRNAAEGRQSVSGSRARARFSQRLCRARRPAERRQIDAPECARRREAEHRDAAAADHAPPHSSASAICRTRRSPSSTRPACTTARRARPKSRHESHRRGGARGGGSVRPRRRGARMDARG